MKYTKEKLEEAVKNARSIRDVLRYFGLKFSGGNHSHLKRRLLENKIDISHFDGQASNRGLFYKGGKEKRPYKEVLVKQDAFNKAREKHSSLKRCLIESGRKYKCEICSNDGKWNDIKLVLAVDHIDGDWGNNEESNLRFLCPNCHSQTDTFGGKNIKPR